MIYVLQKSSGTPIAYIVSLPVQYYRREFLEWETISVSNPNEPQALDYRCLKM